MKPKFRSLSGAALMLVIIPIIAGLLACMPVPIGDPERSRIDPELNGAWKMSEEGKESALYLFRPYDKRTWVVIGTEGTFGASTKIALYKAWLTRLGGKRFMTWEQAGGINSDGSFEPEFWLVFRVDKDNDDQFRLRMIDLEFEGFADIPTPDEYDGDDYIGKMRRKFERVIKRHIDDEEMYSEPLLLSRVPQDELAEAAALFEKIIEFE